MREKIILFCNVDFFFLSHRVPLAELLRDTLGYDVIIACNDTGKINLIKEKGFTVEKINFTRSSKNIFLEMKTIYSMVSLINKYNPVLLHNITIKPSLYGAIAGRFTNKKTKIVNAVSGLGYNFTDGREGLLQKFIILLKKKIYSNGINFIFQNEDDLKYYQSLNILNNSNKYALIKGVGIDTQKVLYSPPVIHKRLDIIFVGRLLKDKGILELLQAALLLKDKYEDRILFSIVGDFDLHNPSGVKQEELMPYIDNNYIVYHGYSDDVYNLIRNAHIVCLPSYREGMPKTLLEAMAVGRPIVTTDVPGCRNCVDEGVNGFYAEAKNVNSLATALEKMINLSDDMLIKMGVASRDKIVKEFSSEVVMKEFKSFFEEIIASKT